MDELNEKLYHACMYMGNNQKEIEELINAGADVNYIDGHSSLHVLTMSNEIDKIKLLLSYGANINIQDIRGRTPLYWASICDFTDMVKLLLENQADVSIPDKKGKTPLESIKSTTVHKQYQEIADLLKQYGAKE
jgi:ankyrin repeat protein